MAVAHNYFLLLNLIAIVITSGTDVCSCEQCRNHRNRYDRCECCRYYQIGRKRSEFFPASVQVSEKNGNRNSDDQSEQGESFGHNRHFSYQLTQARHEFVNPCPPTMILLQKAGRSDGCTSLWQADPSTDGLRSNMILDKKYATVMCNLPEIFRRGGNHPCQMTPDFLQAGLTVDKIGEKLTKPSMLGPYIQRPSAWRFSDKSAASADSDTDVPIEYSPGEDVYPDLFTL